MAGSGFGYSAARVVSGWCFVETVVLTLCCITSGQDWVDGLL